jgi:hypothetical protein
MSFLSGIPIIGNIIDAVSGYQKGKQALKAAKQAGEIAVIERASQSLSDWQTLMAKGSITSWKDEFWTIVFAVPLIMGFINTSWFNGPQIVKDGFASFTAMPEWYQYVLVTMVLASFGIRIKDALLNKITK